MKVHTHGSDIIPLRKKRRIAVVGNPRCNFRPEAKQRNRIPVRERSTCSEYLSGTNEKTVRERAGRESRKIQQRTLIEFDMHWYAACVVGPALNRSASYGLDELCELGIGIGMIGGAGGRSLTVEPYFSCGRPGIVTIQQKWS